MGILSEQGQLPLVPLHAHEKSAAEKWERAPQLRSGNNSKEERSAAHTTGWQELSPCHSSPLQAGQGRAGNKVAVMVGILKG